MSTAPELKRSPSYREVGAGIALASVALSSCHWWFSFSPFNHILRHLTKSVLGGEELHLMFSFLLLTLLHVQISIPPEFILTQRDGNLCRLGVEFCYCCECGDLFRLLAPALWLFMCLPHFTAQFLKRFFTKWVQFNQKGTDHGVCAGQYAWQSGARKTNNPLWRPHDPVFWEWS